ncbi:hypothetical protein IQ07DRAFT_276100 [Pyrenochaeta sp. DS3sAY3a]|nr:hypothetical protein IQ07DRAFT_276100 [Pyrenochaeta sp. DS3sAY3a]
MLREAGRAALAPGEPNNGLVNLMPCACAWYGCGNIHPALNVVDANRRVAIPLTQAAKCAPPSKLIHSDSAQHKPNSSSPKKPPECYSTYHAHAMGICTLDHY